MELKEDAIWKENPETIKTFLEKQGDYEQLCGEIAYILKKNLLKADIEISTITYRAKTLKSFSEKIIRKKYDAPFEDLTDFAGVRVVFLYQNDITTIEDIIGKEFDIIEKVDKLNDKGTDKFGYGAVHYIVKLGKNSSGARYDDLKDLVCEIQVRTVLQDAWAIIEHHLVYKKESEIPSSLQRKLNGLAGLFETADNQFEYIRAERETYLNSINKSIKENNFLDSEINLDTFTSYLKWRFPDKQLEYFEGQLNMVLDKIVGLKLNKISEIDSIIERQKKYINSVDKIIIRELGEKSFMGNKISSSLLTSLLIAIDNKEYLKTVNISPQFKKVIENIDEHSIDQ